MQDKTHTPRGGAPQLMAPVMGPHNYVIPSVGVKGVEGVKGVKGVSFEKK